MIKKSNDSDIETLLSEHYEKWHPGTQEHEIRVLKIIVSSATKIEAATKSLEESINDNAEASQKLSRRIFWLEVIVAIAALIGIIDVAIRLFS